MSYLTISLSNGEGGGLIGSVDDDVTHFPRVEGLHWALAAFQRRRDSVVCAGKRWSKHAEPS